MLVWAKVAILSNLHVLQILNPLPQILFSHFFQQIPMYSSKLTQPFDNFEDLPKETLFLLLLHSYNA